MTTAQQLIAKTICLICLLANGTRCLAQENGQLMDMELDELLNQHAEVHRSSKTASGVAETIKDAPAALVIVTQEDIQKRGYLSIDEVVQDLPGFDTIVTNGTMQVVSYQRGYRTPWTQRTLLLINGKVDNNVWNHSAQLSRQYPLSNIERIEVLYGPAGAVYGPNAFLGVINIITRNPSDLKEGESYLTTQVQAGSFNTYSVDLAAGGSIGELNYSFSVKGFSSDEADIDDYADFAYTNESLLADETNWGPAIVNSDFNNDGTVDMFNGGRLGEYHDPSNDYGILGEVSGQNWKAGVIHWETEESYGPYYAFDKGQVNTPWIHTSTQYYIDINKQVSQQISVNTEILHRNNRVGGGWVESFGGWVSISEWNSYSEAWRFRQQYFYQFNEQLKLTGGIKLENKALTKAYVICGYWPGTLCPSDGGFTGDGDTQPIVDDPNTPEDERSTIDLPPSLNIDNIPSYNKINTRDKGAFIQAIWQHDKWRLNGGVRWDNNSIYGTVVNPRGAAIYHWNPRTSIKFVYGEAFQEPAPKDLFGGWTGRQANPNLKPEKARNAEFIVTHQTKYMLHDISVFHAHYDDVIAGSQNVGGRDIGGFEYRASYHFHNPFYSNEDIGGRLFYTYTDAVAEQQFNNSTGIWENDKDIQGDIAPHKLTWIVDIPLSQRWNANFQINWASERELFSENPLRADSNPDRQQNRKVEAFTTVDLNILYKVGSFSAGLKINNLFEEDYLLPGVESASSGDDPNSPSSGFQNSLLPQVKERVLMGYFRLSF